MGNVLVHFEKFVRFHVLSGTTGEFFLTVTGSNDEDVVLSCHCCGLEIKILLPCQSKIISPAHLKRSSWSQPPSLPLYISLSHSLSQSLSLCLCSESLTIALECNTFNTFTSIPAHLCLSFACCFHLTCTHLAWFIKGFYVEKQLKHHYASKWFINENTDLVLRQQLWHNEHVERGVFDRTDRILDWEDTN